MRTILLVACAILTTACETTSPIDIPPNFRNFKVEQRQATTPDELPDLHPLECYPSEADCKIVGYADPQDVDTLHRYKIRAEGNTKIAAENAAALDATNGEVAQLVEAGKAQENIARIREDQLQYERSERLREKWYYRVMLVLVGAAGVYASGH